MRIFIVKTILIVDDNARVTKLIKTYLESKGFKTITAYEGISALKMFYDYTPDLLILDIMIPGMTGLEIAKEIRKTSPVPIIMITAKSEEADKLTGLEVGADDYIVKPFSPKEMVARVQALFRRIDFDKLENAVVHISPSYKSLVLTPELRQVQYKNKIIDVTALQFNILQIFVEAPCHVFSRKMILDRIDAEDEIFERTIDAHIKNIRKLFGESGQKDGIIQTVHGVGYKIE